MKLTRQNPNFLRRISDSLGLMKKKQEQKQKAGKEINGTNFAVSEIFLFSDKMENIYLISDYTKTTPYSKRTRSTKAWDAPVFVTTRNFEF